MLDVKDLIDAVKGGTIDAQDNPLTNIFNFDIHKFHRHITLSAHIFGTATVLVHKQSYDLWPDETRLAVDASVAEATAAQRAFAAAEDALIIDRLNQSGTKFITLTAEERLQFQNTVAPVIEKQRERFGAALFNLLG